MYTKNYCSYCYAAKTLLAKRGISYEEISLSSGASTERQMQELTGGYTVPQILIDGHVIGGYTELVALDMEGGLGQAT